MLTRDPYASIWAEYKRALAYAEGVGRAPVVATSSCRAALRSQHLHSGGLPAACFNATHFSTFALHQARAWRHMWYHYRKAAALGLRVHRLAYENLLEPRGRLGALARLVEFVLRGERSEEQPPPDSQRHEQRQQRQQQQQRGGQHGQGQQRRSEPPLAPKTSPPPGRIACAFSLADDPRVHRGRHQRDGSPQLASAASAYASSGLVCDMWHLFGAKAKAAGYRPFGKERCGVAHGKRSKRNNAG